MIEWKELEDVFRPTPLSTDSFMQLLARHRSRTTVLVDKGVLDSIFAAANGKQHEIGGILSGTAHTIPNSDSYLTHVKRSLVGFGSDGSPVHMQFTSKSWEAIQAEASSPSDTILGWFHTHPGLGVFMSGTDRRTQKYFFSQPWQVSLVVDPKTEKYDFFAGEESERTVHLLLRD
ncbi:MAG: Mov34/MPN/PAD-1 family protein [Candidatus Bathyarchaeia archaeon]